MPRSSSWPPPWLLPRMISWASLSASRALMRDLLGSSLVVYRSSLNDVCRSPNFALHTLLHLQIMSLNMSQVVLPKYIRTSLITTARRTLMLSLTGQDSSWPASVISTQAEALQPDFRSKEDR